jgi:hypothetical protein
LTIIKPKVSFMVFNATFNNISIFSYKIKHLQLLDENMIYFCFSRLYTKCTVSCLYTKCTVSCLYTKCTVSSLYTKCTVSSLYTKCTVSSLYTKCTVSSLYTKCTVSCFWKWPYWLIFKILTENNKYSILL